MKNIIITSLSLIAAAFFNTVKAQVAFGKDNVSNASALVEFGPGNKGIILPSVASASGAVGGTFIFNTADKAVEVWEERNNNNTGGWTSLTDPAQGITHTFSNAGTDAAATAGVIIGATTTTKPGVLVLESATKAMILPTVANPHLTMKSSVAGTMVYDSAADMLAVYDGANWSYWK
jgi:hypothetical protein